MKSNTKVILSIVIGLIITTGLAVVFVSMQEEKKELIVQSTQLEVELQERDSAYNEIIDIMYGVESKIEKIKQRENLIAEVSGSTDFTEADKKQMVNDMGMIDSLIIQTNETVARLVAKLDNANINLNSFKNRVNQLSRELEDRQNSIAGLREELSEKDVVIADMSADLKSLEYRVDTQEQTIDTQITKISMQEDELNTAFFAIGTEKALVKDGLVSKEGGFLWFGKTNELDPNAEKEKFSEIDIRTTNRVIVDAEKVNLITEHPSDSYEMIKEAGVVKYIDIKNPDKFWEISKYLVVAVKS
ncbi:Cbp1 family collagen-binding glycoprotein adhesin [Ekhidna sp.]